MLRCWIAVLSDPLEIEFAPDHVHPYCTMSMTLMEA